MIISNIHINGFKSIRQMTLPLDPHITVLIGPNESGKTNILKAVEYFAVVLFFNAAAVVDDGYL